MKYPTRGNWSLIYYDFQQQCYLPIQEASALTQIFPNIHVIKEELILIVALPVFCFIENLMKYDQNSSPFFSIHFLGCLPHVLSQLHLYFGYPVKSSQYCLYMHRGGAIIQILVNLHVVMLSKTTTPQLLLTTNSSLVKSEV